MSWGGQPPNTNPYYGNQGPPGRPPPPQQGYGAPPPQRPGYGAPPTQAGAPPPGQGGYGAPPGGYGAPPPQQGSYGAPPPQQGGYRPPPQQGGYGAPSAPPGSGYGGGGYGGAQQPPPGISPDLWQWFQTVDTDRSGQINTTELQQALMNGNWTPFNPETCRLMIGMFDKDKSGTIGIHEFAALWKYIQDWKAMFDRFDTDRSGNINHQELSNAFQQFGYNLSPNFTALCIRVFDRQQRGSINFDDFIQCCVMLKALTDQFRQKDTQMQGNVKIHYEEFLRMVLDNGMV